MDQIFVSEVPSFYRSSKKIFKPRKAERGILSKSVNLSLEISFLLIVPCSSGCCLSFPLLFYFSCLSPFSTPLTFSSPPHLLPLPLYLPPSDQSRCWVRHLALSRFLWGLQKRTRIQKGPSLDILNPVKVTLTTCGFKFCITGGYFYL